MAFQKNIEGPSFQSIGNPAKPARTAPSGLEGLLSAGTQFASMGKEAVDNAADARAEREERGLVHDYTMESLDRSMELHPLARNATSQMDSSRLYDGDIKALNSAAEQAERLQIMQQQTGSLDYMNYQKLAQHRRYLAQYPHLAPELNKLFKDNQGEGVMGYADNAMERDAEQAQARRELQMQAAQAQAEARRKAINDAIVNWGGVPPADPAQAEALYFSSGISDAEQSLQQGANQLNILNNRNDLTRGQREEHELSAARKILPNMHLEASNNFSRIVSGGTFDVDPQTGAPIVSGGDSSARFNPETDEITPEQLQAMDLYIEQMQNYAATEFSETFDTISPQIEAATSFVSSLRDYYAGTITKQTLDGRRELMKSVELERLGQDAVKLEAFGEVVRNIPDNLFSAASGFRLNQTAFGDIATNVMTSMGEVDRGGEIGDAFEGVNLNENTTPQVIRGIATGISANISDPEFLSNREFRENTVNTLESLTVRMGNNPGSINAETYESLMGVFSDPKIIDVLNESEGLTSRNAQVGYAEYARTMREALLEDLGDDVRLETTFEGPVSSQAEGQTPGRRTTGQEQPIVMRVNNAGQLVFAATNRDDRDSVRRAEKLQKRYGKKFTRLNKVYSHVVEMNKEYPANAQYLAAQMVGSDRGITEAFDLGRQQVERMQQQAEERMNRDSGLRSDERGSQEELNGTPVPADAGATFRGRNLTQQVDRVLDMVDGGSTMEDVRRELDALGIDQNNRYRSFIEGIVQEQIEENGRQ